MKASLRSEGRGGAVAHPQAAWALARRAGVGQEKRVGAGLQGSMLGP
jgi:hypothetical protein